MVDELGEAVVDVAVGDRVFGVCDDRASAAGLALLTSGRRGGLDAVLGALVDLLAGHHRGHVSVRVV